MKVILSAFPGRQIVNPASCNKPLPLTDETRNQLAITSAAISLS